MIEMVFKILKWLQRELGRVYLEVFGNYDKRQDVHNINWILLAKKGKNSLRKDYFLNIKILLSKCMESYL